MNITIYTINITTSVECLSLQTSTYPIHTSTSTSTSIITSITNYYLIIISYLNSYIHSYLKLLITYFIGYDTIIINWAIELFDAKGYIYNINTNNLFSLNYALKFMRSRKSIPRISNFNDNSNESLILNIKLIINYILLLYNNINYNNIKYILLNYIINFNFHNFFNNFFNNFINNLLNNIFNNTNIKYNLITNIQLLINYILNILNYNIYLILINNSQLIVIFIYKIGVIITTILLFFTTSTIVSFMLRETQSRMLKFTILLQYNINNRLSINHLVFTHIIETLVFVPIMIGIIFIIFQFFQDQLLTVMVWSMIWSSEVFSVLR